MRSWLVILVGIVAAVVLVIAGLGVGWFWWARYLWGPQYMHGPQNIVAANECADWPDSTQTGSTALGGGPGTMGDQALPDDCSAGSSSGSSGSGQTISIEQAEEAVQAYLDRSGYTGLKIDEVMEFEQNFYAIVQEQDTGIGAMELLVDKQTAAVGPEIGPNMMWNTRYGMHGGGSMMGSRGENTISGDQALSIAQGWLDQNMPGVTTEDHADPFHGYYTIHTMKDGQIDGMLSVHGRTGQVWYHNWHGTFIQMVEEEEH